jgi:hypothetical protein
MSSGGYPRLGFWIRGQALLFPSSTLQANPKTYERGYPPRQAKLHPSNENLGGPKGLGPPSLIRAVP